MPKACGNCVLLVDDDPSIRNLLSNYLEKAGFDAIHAEDGIDALGKLRVTLPKVIISDLEMPRMSGLEFIGIVRRRFPTIPIVAFSGTLPSEFPGETKPDRWIEKSVRLFPELLKVIKDITRETPDDIDLPQVVSTPVRTGPGFAGFIMLTCTDCLRTFRAERTRRYKGEDGIAVCIHCEARVPFLIESSASV
ncbi:MAG TPA: response regulator [Terriglobia bacterium]|nr:response regulator [Terriglobia bacterium]